MYTVSGSSCEVPPKSGESVREEPCSPVVSDSVDVRSPVTCIPTLTDTPNVHFVTNSGEAIGKTCYLNTSGKLVHIYCDHKET